MRGSNNQARGTSELQPLSAGNAGPLRRLYDWTIHWAQTPYGPWALLLLAFAESSFFPIPPDVLLIAMALGAPKKSLRYAGICLVGSVVGGCAGYLIGMCFFEAVGRPILSFYHHLARFDQLQVQFAEHGFLFIFVAALTPIPYKVFTIAAGVSHTYVPLTVLIAASVVGRGLRFFALGVLLRLFGNRVKRFIDRYFNLLTIAFVVLLVLGFVCVKIFLDKKRPAEGPALTPAILAPVKTDARSPGGVHMLSEEAKQTLLNVARQSVEAAIRNGPLPKFDIEDEELNQGQGAFVTLKTQGQLRGCIGRFMATEPLWKVVREMAGASATRDVRFIGMQLRPEEFPILRIEISVLSPLQRISDPAEEVELGKHGIYIKQGMRSGCFLPQVATETGWTKEEFLSNCCAGKAGLPPDAWQDPQTEVSVFTAEVFGEED